MRAFKRLFSSDKRHIHEASLYGVYLASTGVFVRCIYIVVMWFHNARQNQFYANLTSTSIVDAIIAVVGAIFATLSIHYMVDHIGDNKLKMKKHWIAAIVLLAYALYCYVMVCNIFT